MPYNDAHFALVRPTDVQVDPVLLEVGDYDSAFKCLVWELYDCVIRYPTPTYVQIGTPIS